MNTFKSVQWQVFHILITMAYIIYPYVTHSLPSYHRNLTDTIFIALTFATFYGWFVFKNECIISVFEKLHMYKNYKLGDCPAVHPHECLFSKAKHWLWIYLLCNLSLVIVLYRTNCIIAYKLVIGACLSILLITQLNTKSNRLSHCATMACSL